MTRSSYKVSFGCQWITLLIVVPLALVGALIAGIVLLAREFERDILDDETIVVVLVGIIAFTIAVITMLWLCGTIVPCCLVRSRVAGNVCAPCFRRSQDVVLRNAEDVQAYQQRLSTRVSGEDEGLTQPFATVVGRGWSFFLNKTPPKGPHIFMHQLTGRNTTRLPTHANGVVFYAGTTMAQMLDDLRQSMHATLASTPSHGTITLGGWVGGSAHGSGGTQWEPTIGGGTVLDQSTGMTTVLNSGKELKNLIVTATTLSIPDASPYVVIDVEVLAVPDRWVRLEARRHVTLEDCNWWLRTDSRLRCTFAGKRGTMMLLWCDSELNEETRKHIDPHFCSRECRYFQADLLSVIQGARAATKRWFAWPVEPQEKWDGLTRLSNANQFSPTISALAMAIALQYNNVEFILRVKNFDELVLDHLHRALVIYHTVHGGRTEVRFGVYKATTEGKLFLDVSFPNLTTALVAYGVVVSKMVFMTGRTTPQPLAFHPGKTLPNPHAFASFPNLKVVSVREL